MEPAMMCGVSTLGQSVAHFDQEYPRRRRTSRHLKKSAAKWHSGAKNPIHSMTNGSVHVTYDNDLTNKLLHAIYICDIWCI